MKNVSNQREILSKNIKDLLHSRGKTQTDMARDLEIAETTVSSWLNAKKYPRIDKIQMMADYFNVSRSRITEEKQQNLVNESFADYNTVSFYDTDVAAGIPSPVEAFKNDNKDKIKIADEVLGKYAGDPNIFVTKVNGESMNNIIPNKSLIAVKRIENIFNLKNRDIVVFRNGGDLSVKRFINDKINQRVIFKPDSSNEEFVDIVIPYENTQDLEIYGKVVIYVVQL